MTDVIDKLKMQAAGHYEAAKKLESVAGYIQQFTTDIERNGFVTGIAAGTDGVIEIFVHPPSSQRSVFVGVDLGSDPSISALTTVQDVRDGPVLETIAIHDLPPSGISDIDPIPKKSKWPASLVKNGSKSQQTTRPAPKKPKAAQAPTPPRKDAPGLITTPFTPEDDSYLITRTLAGDTPATIAAALTRKIKQVANRKHRLKNEIDAARKHATSKRRDKKREEPTASDLPDIGMSNIDWKATHAKLEQSDGWTPARDRKLVQLIVDGAGVAGAGSILKVNSEKANARYIALTAGAGVGIKWPDRDMVLAALIERDGDA